MTGRRDRTEVTSKGQVGANIGTWMSSDLNLLLTKWGEVRRMAIVGVAPLSLNVGSIVVLTISQPANCGRWKSWYDVSM